MQGGSLGPLLKSEGLSKAFGEVLAVDNVNFEVHEGERLGVIGPNGSGKTTLFNCLSGFTPATSGSVWWRDPMSLAGGLSSGRGTAWFEPSNTLRSSPS